MATVLVLRPWSRSRGHDLGFGLFIFILFVNSFVIQHDNPSRTTSTSRTCSGEVGCLRSNYLEMCR